MFENTVALADETQETEVITDAEPIIKKEDIREAHNKLEKFKQAKKSVDKRVIDNEEWFRQRHWKFMDDGKKAKKNDDAPKSDNIEPTSAWMFNSLFNKHADAMDNYPTCNFVPREEADRKTAEELSAIVPVILKLNKHRQLYRRSWWYLLKFGTVIEGTFWDKRKYYGMGDITISRIDILNFFPDPDVLDIQEASDVFVVHLKDKKALKQQYPEIDENSLSGSFTLEKYHHDDQDNDADKVAVIDWYYKKYTENGTILHFCQFVGDEILYASENDPECRDRGFYEHGEYPFDITQLFPVETSIFSFGFIDIMRSPQAYIDRLDQAILTNVAKAANPKTLVSKQLGINKDDLTDLSKPLIEFTGHIDASMYQQLTVGNIPPGIINHYLNKINELKETSGNRDVNQGSAGSVTSGTAIAALQESGSKGSRDMLLGNYDTFESQCKKIVSLITQHYTLPRKFRITNSQGQEEFISFSNKQLVPQSVENEDTMRIPEFDVDIVAQKQNRFTTNANNEMALAFYNAGFFNPQNADQASACIEMMTFDSKEQILNKIRQNGLMFQQIQQMQQQILALSQIVAQVTGDARVFQAANVQGGLTDNPGMGGNLLGTPGTIGPATDNSQAAKARRRAMEAATV